MTASGAAATVSAMTTPQMMTERDLEGLRAVLNEWDPLGVMAIAEAVPGIVLPEDEYDCLRDVLAAELVDGADRDELIAAIDHEMEHHFEVRAGGTAEVVDRVLAWWRSRG